MTAGSQPTFLTRLATRTIPALVVLTVGAFAFLPLCDLHFDCGCTWPGAGDYAHCDIHVSGPPDCPWCDHGWLGYGVMGLAAALGLVAVWILPQDTFFIVVALTGLGACLFGILAAGIATSLWLGLPVLAGL